MANARRTFNIDTGALSRMGDKFARAQRNYDIEVEKRMKTATGIVWRIAHQKRPMITKAQMKAEGRRTRVSDPNAQAGVPVQTGRLQGSITQDVERIKGGTFRGIIETKGIPYAGFIEHGTSKMRARPFMRPAIALTKDALKKVFGMKITQTK